ncbi:hypothetical protein [Burkholderia stabilis]|uniref:hypothetical protein n=1 Tax=Burkholderia stabilis TaxID=95485 RepID=UPI001F4AB4FC|nr:hypothetical protein [Burkholderia stabilis]
MFQNGILSDTGAHHPLFQAAVVQMLICLNDLLQKASKDKVRVNFVDQVQEGVGDVTDLVSKCRNAACHIDSSLCDVEFGRYRFGVLIGRGDGVIVGDRPVIESEFDDDVAIFFGTTRLYLRRHAFRALREVGAALHVRMDLVR